MGGALEKSKYSIHYDFDLVIKTILNLEFKCDISIVMMKRECTNSYAVN